MNLEAKVKVSPESFQRFVDAAELAAIQLKSCSADCKAYPTMVLPSNTHLDVSNNIRWSRQAGLLICFLEGKVIGSVSKEYSEFKKGQQLFEVSATVTIVYKVDLDDVEDSVINLFATRNALFNGYPFLREAFSNLTSKMGLQPVVLPLLKTGSVGAGVKKKKTAEVGA